ncbi:histidine phosphatase family protein [Fibrobacter sp. UWB11]|uniref:histidine phosphatase family protein n=1 Tax=Fibrobacter sp. UWB11 TaxID=1896202 RepID=UPI0009410707|nr:histidine phosphatase family protein [Fibrobacter sp. UWB11]
MKKMDFVNGFFLLAAGFFLVAPLNAQTSDAELAKHPEFTSSNYLVYPEPVNTNYAKIPAGYKPFYISHYGRHGSRYHHSDEEYTYLFETLSKADSAQKLTEIGKQALAYAKVLANDAAPRKGDLTQVGVKQHEGIASRMYKNFREVFKDWKIGGKKVTPRVKAYASTSGRCIVSMAAFNGELRSLNPKIKPELISGKSYMKFISAFDWGKLDYSKVKAYTDESDKLWKNVNPQPFLKKLFNDSNYVVKNIETDKFYNRFFEIATSLQGMDKQLLDDIAANAKIPADSIVNLFTTEEKITRWKAQNAWWYSLVGTSPLIASSEGLKSAAPTLQNILDEADEAIALDTSTNARTAQTPIAATLRFGHDATLLPLAALMQLPFASAKVSDLTKLHEQWNDFKIIPMAANLQMVFYKSSGNNSILVKVLYNEIEQTLPIECKDTNKDKCPAAPYYRWDDVREFYSAILYTLKK